MNNLHIKYKIRKDRRSKFRNLIPDLDWNLLDFVVWQTCAHRRYIVIGLSNSRDFSFVQLIIESIMHCIKNLTNCQSKCGIEKVLS